MKKQSITLKGPFKVYPKTEVSIALQHLHGFDQDKITELCANSRAYVVIKTLNNMHVQPGQNLSEGETLNLIDMDGVDVTIQQPTDKDNSYLYTDSADEFMKLCQEG